MRFRSLESRIATLILLLILLIQLLGFFAIHLSIDENARAAVHNDLKTGNRIFMRLLDQSARELSENARLLASDHYLREALAKRIQANILAILSSHGVSSGSNFTMLWDSQHAQEISTYGTPKKELVEAAKLLITQIEKDGANYLIIPINQKPYQIVAAPIESANSKKWVIMSASLSQDLASLMRDISSLQVIIFIRDLTGDHRIASTLLPSSSDTILEQLRADPNHGKKRFIVNVDGSEYGARVVAINYMADSHIYVVLVRSVSEVVASYQKLRFTLLILMGLGVGLAILGSIFTAKRITQPLIGLAEDARRISEGDFETPIASAGEDEIGQLSWALEEMRYAVSRRADEIRRLAYWDNLTELPNRLQFSELLRDTIQKIEDSGQDTCSVLLMDVNRFKNINDVLGHGSGDLLLQQFAQRLAQLARPNTDVVARLGGDEFAVLLRHADGDRAILLAESVAHMLEQPFMLGDQAVDLNSAIGIAFYPAHANNAEDLLGAAEVAMYAAKREKHGYALYDSVMDTASKQNLSLLGQLRVAFEKDEFRLYAQPKVSFETGKVVGVETLLRWVHPERGLVMPENFIPFAEQTGYIRVLSHWAMTHAMSLCRTLNQAGYESLKISVNLSTRDLLDHRLCERIEKLLERNQVQASSFCLEITESTIMDDPLRSQITIDRLSQMGFDLSIDDFGTGYSSLAYLKKLPVSELKIDQSFVRNMENNPDDIKIVRSTIDLGHNLGLQVVAEGVETQAVWDLLLALSCDVGQGYLIGEAVPTEKILQYLEHWKGLPSVLK